MRNVGMGEGLAGRRLGRGEVWEGGGWDKG